jgi:hypothetical protein
LQVCGYRPFLVTRSKENNTKKMDIYQDLVPFGDGLYNPFMVILGLASYWVYVIV